MVEVMINAPKVYTTTIAVETRIREAMTIPLTLDRLQYAMTRFWRIEHGDSDNECGSDPYDEGDTVITVVEKDKHKKFQVW